MDSERPEYGSVHVTVTRDIELCRTFVSDQVQGTDAGAAGRASYAICRCIEPLLPLRHTRALRHRVRNLARGDARAIVSITRKIVVVARGHRKGLTAVSRPDAAHRPTI